MTPEDCARMGGGMVSDEDLAAMLLEADREQRRRDLWWAKWMDAAVAIAAVLLVAAITPVVLGDVPAPIVAEVRK